MEVDYAPTEAELASAEELENAKKYAPVEFATDPTKASLTEDVLAPLFPPIALGVLAFGLVGLVIWAGQRVTNSGLTHGIGYTRALDREMATPAADMAYSAYFRPTAARPGSGYAPSVAPPPVNGALVNGPFLGIEQRAAAHAAIQPIRDLMNTVRGVDAKGLWDDPASGQGAGQNGAAPIATIQLPVNGVPPAPFPGRPGAVFNGTAPGSVTRSATFQGNGVVRANANPDALYQIDQIHQRAEAMASEVDRVTPPIEFPPPLQPGVKAVSQELHGYLKDADLAATADPQQRAVLRAQGARRLQQAQAYIDYMDSMINGTTSPTNAPRPLVGMSNANGR